MMGDRIPAHRNVPVGTGEGSTPSFIRLWRIGRKDFFEMTSKIAIPNL